MKRKVVRTTIIVWALVVVLCGCVYIFTDVGRTSPPSAEYEIRWDYRLVFFAVGCFPLLALALAAALLIARRFLPERSERR